MQHAAPKDQRKITSTLQHVAQCILAFIDTILVIPFYSIQIELPEISLETFLALLEYLYTDHSPIEDSDSIGILVLANQYGLPRLINLCELYITKQVDKACAQSIADADIDIIGVCMCLLSVDLFFNLFICYLELLLSTQLHNAHQLSAWCLHFIASNYVAFENNEHFEILTDESKGYIETNRS